MQDAGAPAPAKRPGRGASPRRLFRARSRKAGLPPGTLVHTGEQRLDRPVISVIDYTEADFEERQDIPVEDALAYRDTASNSWINVDGLHDVALLQRLGEHYGLHPLVLEDIGNTDQRPKIEDHGEYAYIVARMLRADPASGAVHAEQLSVVLGKRFVLSFQETHGDVFDPLRERLRTGKGQVRRQGVDYLCYRLLDAIVDHYFVALERLGERIEDLERELIEDPQESSQREIHRLKNELIYVRRSVWPLREVLATMDRQETSLVRKATRPYLRDVYDHAIQVMDTVETYRDVLSGLLELYMTSISNRMNEVMKTLTIIATIFIPLTFIAGVYGMNFAYMPELGWRYGYFASLAVMAVVGLSLVVYFRRKDWI